MKLNDENKENIIRQIIEGRKGFYGYKLPELSERSGISYSILLRRMKEPLSLTFKEFLKLDRVLHFDDRDRERLIEVLK